MNLRLLLLVVVFLFHDAAAQSSQSDFLPLALGNEWVYKYQAVDDNIFNQSAVSDSGVAVYTIVSKELSADSIIWGIRETRDIIRASYSYWGGLHYFSRLPMNDSVLFSVIEYGVGDHRLSRPGEAQDDWRSVFCMFAKTSDSTQFYRYVPDAKEDTVTLTTMWNRWDTTATFPTDVVRCVLQRGTGIRSVEYSTPGIVGAAYSTHHKLQSQTILSARPALLELSPSELSLENNYPNPFNPRTILSFSLGSRERVTVAIVDILGRPISILLDDVVQAGKHSVVWDASREASGTYICVAKTASSTKCMRLLLLK